MLRISLLLLAACITTVLLQDTNDPRPDTGTVPTVGAPTAEPAIVSKDSEPQAEVPKGKCGNQENTLSQTMEPPQVDKDGPAILIIGCGISGIGAAERLFKHGFRNVRILEASDRCGGRIWSTNFGKGVVEIGAQWIHGPSDGNPVFRLASQYGLLPESALLEENKQMEPGEHPPGQLETLSSSGKVLNASLVNTVFDIYATLMDQTRKFFNLNSTPAESIGQYMKKEIARQSTDWEDDDPTKKWKLAILKQLLNSECSMSGTDSMDDVALKPYGEYKTLTGLDCTFPSGFSSLIECMMSSFPKQTVLYNKLVRTVHWNGTFKGPHTAERTFPVLVEGEDGDTFPADHVIVTVALGFLKEKFASFLKPPLPLRKVQAIQKMGFGTVNKIILEFETPFWTPDCSFIQLIWEEESPLVEGRPDLQTAWFKRLSGFIVLHPPEQHSHVLCGFIAGKESEYMETLTDEEVISNMTQVLRQFTGNPGLTPPVRILRSKWHSRPLTKGSYSYVAVGTSGQDIDTIAEPLPEKGTDSKVLFAGEATHRTFYSTTHGALESGWREGERLIDLHAKPDMLHSKSKL